MNLPPEDGVGGRRYLVFGAPEGDPVAGDPVTATHSFLGMQWAESPTLALEQIGNADPKAVVGWTRFLIVAQTNAVYREGQIQTRFVAS